MAHLWAGCLQQRRSLALTADPSPPCLFREHFSYNSFSKCYSLYDEGANHRFPVVHYPRASSRKVHLSPSHRTKESVIVVVLLPLLSSLYKSSVVPPPLRARIMFVSLFVLSSALNITASRSLPFLSATSMGTVCCCPSLSLTSASSIVETTNYMNDEWAHSHPGPTTDEEKSSIWGLLHLVI